VVNNQYNNMEQLPISVIYNNPTNIHPPRKYVVFPKNIAAINKPKKIKSII